MTRTGASHNGLRISFLRVSFRCLAIVLGAANAWVTRFSMNPDGISYLDIGDAYWRGDWHAAVNAYWSPFYSWILGLFLKVLKPSPYWEYPVVHLANFVIYVGALASFEFFLGNFIKNSRAQEKGPNDAGAVALPEWAWWSLGYSLFIWTSLVLISLATVTPDICVAGFVYLAAGLILRIRSGSASQRDFALLGIVLGFAHLAKAAMFPLAFVFLAMAGLSMHSPRKAAPRVLLSAIVFLLVTAPFTAAISRATGHLTIGDSGRLNYAGYVDGVDFWFPGDSGRLNPVGEGVGEKVDEIEFPDARLLWHPVKRIFDRPAAYQFEGHVEGTYPFWYDPSYWQEGIKPHFDLRGQARAVSRALKLYCLLCLNPWLQLNVFAGVCFLYLLAPKPSVCVRRAAANWPLLLPALAGLILYALVFVLYRYVASFVVIVWVAAFSGVWIPSCKWSKRLIAAVSISIVATTVASAAWHVDKDPRRIEPVYWEAAMALKESGIRAGDKVAVIAEEPIGGDLPFVARLARTQIVAQVNRPDRFFATLPPTQVQVIEAIARSGAKAILSTADPPRSPSGLQWEALGPTDYYVCLLEKGRQ